MSVIVTVQFPVADVAKAVEGLHANASFLEETTASTKDRGIISHRFVAGDGELMVIDEWPSEEQFRTFFAANPKIGEVMGSIGLSGEPTISVYESVDAPGTV
jgi:hypothetical protein